MAGNTENGDGQRVSRWRIAAWTGAVFLLLLPLIAMQFTEEVAWGVADFVFAAVLLVGSLGAYELAVRRRDATAYRAGVGLAITAAFLLVWVNGAVGIVGSEANDANLMYYGALAVGLLGAFVARFQPRGMARSMAATALALAAAAVVAVVSGASEPTEVLVLTGFFAALFIGSAWLFREVARGGTE